MKVQVRHFVILAASIVALMLASCETDDSATSFDAGINEADICEEIAEVMCHNMFECCTGKERENTLGEEITRTESECVEDMIIECETVGADIIQARESETVSFDMEAAKACVESLVLPDDANCTTNIRVDMVADLCMSDLLITGLVEEGSDCFWDFECEGEAYCSFDFTCKDLPTDGETCTPASDAPSDCAADHDCDSTTNECTARVGEGEDCDDAACMEDFYCDDIDTDAPLTCAARLAGGEDCTADQMCETFDCRQGFCDMDSFGCFNDDDCVFSYCEGVAPLTSCDDQTNPCAMLCTGDMTTSCVDDTDCTSAGGTCAEPACVAQTCIDGGICEYGGLDEIDYCEVGMKAPCAVFGLEDFECSF